MKFKGKAKGDLLLVAALLLIGLGILLYNQVIVPSKSQAAWALIEIEGEVVRELDLRENAEGLRFDTEHGYNIVEVKNGWVRVSEADCPEQICVNTGWRGHAGQIIVCMPHRFVVKVMEDALFPSDLDSFTY